MIYGDERKQDSIPGALFMISVAFEDAPETPCDYIIVSDRKQSKPISNIYHYSESNARELITSYLRSDHLKRGIINGKRYVARKLVYSRDGSKMFNILKPVKTIIKPHGGFNSSLKEGNAEIVDILMYSPFTKRYEISKATFDKNLEICYMDIIHFRNFVAQFGNPGLPYEFKTSSRKSQYWATLHDQSILMAYGYNVSQSENLSTRYRRELLAEIMDLEILTAEEIIRYLNFFIAHHQSDKDYYARFKWAEDVQFVLGYKINPERFLVTSQKPDLTREVSKDT